MKITLNEFLSLDGVMQGPGGKTEDESGGFERGGWMMPLCLDEEFGQIVTQWFSTGDALLLGRSTYQMMYEYWSQVTDEDPVTRALNHGRKYIVSSTLTDETATWDNSTVIGDGLEGVARLKEEGEGELQVHGSWQLAHSLHNAGLVDEYRLLIFPTVVDRATTPSGATALTLLRDEFRTATAEIHDGHDTVA